MAGCDNCDTSNATSRCVECDEQFCEPCFQTLHKSQKKKVHQKVAIEGATQEQEASQAVKCDNCNEKDVAVKCNDCDESYCEACASEQHKSAKKKKHGLVSIQTNEAFVVKDTEASPLTVPAHKDAAPEESSLDAHVHGPGCNHDHGHIEQQVPQDNEHVHHDGCRHDHSDHAPHAHAQEDAHVHGPGCNHDHGHAHGHEHVNAHAHAHPHEDTQRPQEGASNSTSVAEEAQAAKEAIAAEIWTDLSAFNFELAMKEGQLWIEKVTGEKFSGTDFQDSLKSGQLLCKLVNAIKPGSVVKTHSMKAMFACMENITFFLGACRSIGLEDSQLFESLDLYEGRNMKSVVITLYWLGRAARGMGFKGPHLNLFAFTRLKCSRCRKLIEDDQYEVNLNSQWHKTCSNCCNCKKYIGPKDEFVFLNNKIYCPECLCGECFVPLEEGKWVMKDGKKVCLDCHNRTLCTRCEKVLVPGQTYTVANKKYCETCVCGSCHKPLREGQFKNVNGINYCNDCLCVACGSYPGKDAVTLESGKYCRTCVCHDCTKPFDSRGFVVKNNNKYCPDCLCARCQTLLVSNYAKFEGKRYCTSCLCGECKKPLGDAVVSKGATSYHKQCVCARCETAFGKNPVVELDGNKYCANCVCSDCNTPLLADGSFSQKEGKSYHNKCLCTRCTNPFAGRTAHTHQGSRYCPDCVCGRCDGALPQWDFLAINNTSYCYKCVCGKCRSVFPKDNMDAVAKGDRNFCQQCVCKSCTKPLVGRTGYITTPDSVKLCVDCVCARCEKKLDTPGTKYCSTCVCVGCSAPLATAKGHHQNAEAAYCGKCACAKCATPVYGKQNVYKSDNKVYCADCSCTQCHSPLVNIGFVTTPDNGKVCAKCACGRCDKVFSSDEKRVKKGERTYCARCVCSSCENVFSSAEFSQVDGANYCATCVCGKCEKVLKGASSVKNADRSYCADCACASCQKPALAGLPHVTKKGRKYCVDCVCGRCEDPLSNSEKAAKHCGKCVCVKCIQPLDLLEDHTCNKCKRNAPKSSAPVTTHSTPVKQSTSSAAASSPASANTPPNTPAAAAQPSVAQSPSQQQQTPTKASAPSPSTPQQQQQTTPTKSSAPASPQLQSTKPSSPALGFCAECGGGLATPMGTVAVGNSYYHKTCFTCSKCRKPITGSYSEENSKIYCTSCYRDELAPSCGGCGRSIVTGSMVKALDTIWHSECFVCTGCKKGFGKGGFHQNNGKPYCLNCFVAIE